jgi:hypothetical protein
VPDIGGNGQKDMKKSIKHKIEKPIFDEEGYQTNIKDLNGEKLPAFKNMTILRMRGGARPGAGRKALGKKAVLLHLKPKAIEAVRAKAKKERRTISEVVDELVLKSL